MTYQSSQVTLVCLLRRAQLYGIGYCVKLFFKNAIVSIHEVRNLCNLLLDKASLEVERTP